MSGARRLKLSSLLSAQCRIHRTFIPCPQTLSLKRVSSTTATTRERFTRPYLQRGSRPRGLTCLRQGSLLPARMPGRPNSSLEIAGYLEGKAAMMTYEFFAILSERTMSARSTWSQPAPLNIIPLKPQLSKCCLIPARITAVVNYRGTTYLQLFQTHAINTSCLIFTSY